MFAEHEHVSRAQLVAEFTDKDVVSTAVVALLVAVLIAFTYFDKFGLFSAAAVMSFPKTDVTHYEMAFVRWNKYFHFAVKVSYQKSQFW